MITWKIYSKWGEFNTYSTIHEIRAKIWKTWSKKNNFLKTSIENFSKGYCFKCAAVSRTLYMTEYKHHSLEILITVEPTTVMGPVCLHDPHITWSLKQLFALLKVRFKFLYLNWTSHEDHTCAWRLHTCVSTLVSEKLQMSITVLRKLTYRQQLATTIWK